MDIKLKLQKIKTYRNFVLILFLCTIVLSPLTARAYQDILTPEQALNRYRIRDLRLSPDIRYIALVVTEPVKGTSSNSDVWIYDINKSELKQFTTSEKSDRSPAWSLDSEKLYFISGRLGSPQIYAISINGGEAVAVTENETGINSFSLSADGNKIAYMAMLPKTEEEKKRDEDKDDARNVDRTDRHPYLSVFDIKSGESKQLTTGAWKVSEFAWAPDGETLIVSATDHKQPELETNRIYSLNISDESLHEITYPERPFGNIKISPDGSTISYTGSRTDGPTATDLFMLPMAGGSAVNLTEKIIDRSIGAYYWRNNENIITSIADGFSREIIVFGKDGSIEKPYEFEVQPPGSFVEGGGVFAYVGETTTEAPELWISKNGGKHERVSEFNKYWDNIALQKLEIIEYKSFDGRMIEAGLLKPAGYQQGGKYPAVVLIHGGPSGVWSDRFNSWGQLLAARGFVILYPNIRGSIGYGHEFLVSNRRDWGGGDYKDVMAGVDYLIEQGLADPERIGIGGWSYGGYMAAWAVTQTKRFKASVSGAPMTDLALEYGAETPSINAYDTWYLGTPYENLELFIERSPTTFIKNVVTPTLILCGENDVIDPIEQCSQFYRGLKRYGVDTEFIRYPREGHGIREEKHQIDMLNRVIDWYEKYLK